MKALATSPAERTALLRLIGISALQGVGMSGVMILVNRTLQGDGGVASALSGVLSLGLVLGMGELNRRLIPHTAGALIDQLTARRVAVADRLRNTDLRATERLVEVETQLAQEFALLDELPFLLVTLSFMGATIVLSSLYIGVLSSAGLTVWLAIIAGIAWYQRRTRAAMSRAAPALGVARRSFGRALRLRLEGFAQLHFDARARTECRDELCALEQGCAEGQGRLNQTLGGSLAWGEDVLLLGLAVVLFRLPEAAGLSAGTQYQVTTMILSISGMTLVFLALSFQIRLIGGAYERLVEIEGQLAPGSGPAQTRPLLSPGPELSLEIQRACFAYEAGGFRVGPIDLRVRGGDLVIIRGGNGSGKTTLMRVLAGLYPTSSGALILGGRRAEAVDAEWYRAHVTAIFTGQHLFDAPYGLHASPGEVAALLERFGLSDAVALKDGRFTRTTLSSGQSKRLAMVVALLEHRPILLLDEWDSHQDPGLRTFYYETLLPELKGQGKIVIAVSHDARRFHLADHLLHLEGGRRVEEGDQAEGVSPRGDTPPQGG